MNIKEMTDQDLLEETARQVLGFTRNKQMMRHFIRYPEDKDILWVNTKGDWVIFNCINNANDLQKVKDKFSSWIIIKDGDAGIHKATVIVESKATQMTSETEWRAVCEAALKAKEGENEAKKMDQGN